MTRPSFTSRFDTRRERGQAIAETIVVVPLLLFVGMAILHFALLAQAKSNLEYAALMAARIGATNPNFGVSSTNNLMVNEVIKRMAAVEMVKTQTPKVKICILRPNQAAFSDPLISTSNLVAGSRAIPNDNLPFRSTAVGSSGMSVQDANILHLEVSYLFQSPVPFMNFYDDGNSPTKHGTGTPLSPYVNSTVPGMRGVWIKSEAVVVMQTPALLNATTQSMIAGTSTFTACPP